MILRSLMERRGEEVAGGALTDRGWISSMVNSGGGMSTSGLAVTEWTAEGIPALYACQRAISETVGQIPLKLMRTSGKGKTPDTDNPLYWVLHNLFNPEMTAFEGKEMLTRHLAGWGNAYGEIVRNASGQVTAIWPLMPWRMRVDRDDLNRRRWTYTAPNGRTFVWVFNPNTPPIFHLRINSLDGLVGRSPVRVLMDSVGMTQAVNQFGADWFNNYSSPAVALEYPGRLKPEARQHLREEWEKLRGSWGNKHRVAILQEGMKLARYSCPPEEAQFIETRSFQIEETARMYRVPLFAIQHMTKSTSWGTGIEQMMLGWLATGLMAYLVQWQQAGARDCLTQRTFTTHQLVWVLASLLRTDIKTQMDALKIQKEIGAASPNDILALLDLNPRTDEFADEYDVGIANTMPASLALKKLAAGAAADFPPQGAST